MSSIRDQAAELNEEMILWDGLDEAVVGFVYVQELDGHVAVYGYNAMIQAFIDNDDMEPEEAEEWVQYNIVGAFPGKYAPPDFV